ncbi:MAG: hypothetical protein ACYC5K_00325 [Saccharofermentanales bacterium]
MKKKQKKKFEDDGRVIADMSFEGTPWENTPRSSGRNKTAPPSAGSSEPLDTKQTLRAIGGALLAALMIGLVFVVGLLLFLLFAVHVWFR